MIESVTYEAVTAAGVPIRTFASRDLALNWWDSHEGVCMFPGATLRVATKVERTIYRTIRRDRLEAAA